MINLEKIYDVLFFVIQAHQGQKMIHPVGVDYSAHFFGVTLTAITFAKNENVNMDIVVAVSLLHDTIEDTNVSFEEIESKFGKEIAEGVLALTKNKNLPKEMRMSDCLNRILQLNKKEIALVKLADRCFNTRCKVDCWTSEKQQAYLEEAKDICDKIGFYCEPLKNQILKNIEKLKNNIL